MENLGNLNERDLLILVNERVASIGNRLNQYEQETRELHTEVTKLKVQMRLWMSLAAFAAGILGGAINYFLFN